jgi:hypothetical protein
MDRFTFRTKLLTEASGPIEWCLASTIKNIQLITRTFKQAVLQDGIFKNFEDSPITAEMKVSDVCIYKPGDLNKIGKEGRTSWDSFSYAIQMGHNVWSHINAVQEANRQYDAGVVPKMLVQEQFDRVFFRDVVETIFAATTREEANALIDQ